MYEKNYKHINENTNTANVTIFPNIDAINEINKLKDKSCEHLKVNLHKENNDAYYKILLLIVIMIMIDTDIETLAFALILLML